MSSLAENVMSRVRKKLIEINTPTFISLMNPSTFSFLDAIGKTNADKFSLSRFLDNLVICDDSTYDLFCYTLLVTGQYKLFDLLEPEVNVKKLEEIAVQYPNPWRLPEISQASSMDLIDSENSLIPFKISSNFGSPENEQMSESRRNFLDHYLGVLRLCLNLAPILEYLEFYRVFSKEQGTPNHDQSYQLLVDGLKHNSNIAFERLCHALILNSQIRLYLFFRDLVDLDKLEEMSKSHMHMFQSSKNHMVKPQLHHGRMVEASHDEEMVFSDENCSQDEEIGTEIPEPNGLLSDLSVDQCDVPTASQLDYYKENKDHIYRNFSSPKGLAMIINNREFSGGHKTRYGSEVDEANIRSLLEGLGYRVRPTYKNLSASSMKKSLLAFGRHDDHRHMDSCVVVVLSHGEYEEIIGADDGRLSIHDFLSCLNGKNAPLLAGKPKIFIIQACRGNNFDHGIVRHIPVDEPECPEAPDTGAFTNLFSCVFPGRSIYTTGQLRAQNFTQTSENTSLLSSSLTTSSSIVSPSSTSRPSSQKFKVVKEPTEADMLIAFATTPLYVSWRNSMAGSWFIQSICEVFSKYAATEDILTMLTRVNQRVARVYQSSQGGEKQIPEFATRFQKKFYFFPGVNSE